MNNDTCIITVLEPLDQKGLYACRAHNDRWPAFDESRTYRAKNLLGGPVPSGTQLMGQMVAGFYVFAFRDPEEGK